MVVIFFGYGLHYIKGLLRLAVQRDENSSAELSLRGALKSVIKFMDPSSRRR